MEADKQLEALYRLPRGTLHYEDESDVITFVSIAGDDHFDTSKLMAKSRERISALFHQHFEVQ